MSKSRPLFNGGPLGKKSRPELTSEQIMAICAAKGSPIFQNTIKRAEIHRENVRKYIQEQRKENASTVSRETYDWSVPNEATPLSDEEKAEMGNYIRYSIGKLLGEVSFTEFVALRRLEKQQGVAK